MAKFHEATHNGSKVLAANTVHFKPIFDPQLKKIVRGNPVPDGRCASKTWSFSSVCKNLVAQHLLGAKIRSSEKGAFGGCNFTSRFPRLLEQSSPNLFCLTREESR